ncbi:MAG: LPS export ABC transporter ATP-binding protein [Planctomycetota bacterium]|nr:LPS export ABC transporter ATP-binding protein [Planctomycetota bacterium]
MALLSASNLRKSFNGRVVVNGVSITVNPAEVVGLLGRNGAGKTTSFRMTIGMIDADGGQVLFDGQDVTAMPMYRRARLGMGYLSQEPSVFQRLTCEENLLAILETLPIPGRERRIRAGELLAQFGLTHKAHEAARTCSGGERRKLEIARALVTNPRLILLDEPFSGVDPIAVEDLQAEIRRLASRGIAALITDHNVQQTLRVCDRAYIIDDGRVFAEGTPRELINNEMVRRVYLGSLFRGDEFDPPAAPPPAPATQPAPAAKPQAPVPNAPKPAIAPTAPAPTAGSGAPQPTKGVATSGLQPGPLNLSSLRPGPRR